MFTNTDGSPDHRRGGAVTRAMDLWQACLIVLALDAGLGEAISSNATSSVIRQIESCPDVGYFFKRELSPNLVESGPCFLCFCKENGTATCWERDRRRCDVERYHHHRVGRHSRYRRSFSDVFFRDATRDFFGKSLPQQCKPYESSFSDGCPPADWCIGCTICDCDSNGQWDCHILSFCDGKENKKKVKLPRNKSYKKSKKSLDYDDTEIKPTKTAQGKKTEKKTTVKPNTSKLSKKNVKKEVKSKVGNKKDGRKTEIHPVPKQSAFKNKTTRKVARKTQNNAYRSFPKRNGSKVIIKKIVSTRKPIKINHNAVRGHKLNPNNSETVKVGQKIIKQVMTHFKKILAKGVNKINEAKRTGKDCRSIKKRDKETYNIRSKAVAKNKNKYKRSGLLKENYTNTRSKREIFNRGLVTENISIITLPRDAEAVIPLNASKDEYISTINETSTPLILEQEIYNEHTIKNDSSSISTTASTTLATEVEKNTNLTINIANKHIISEIKENDIQNNMVIPVKSNDIKENNDTENDIKWSKWYIIKIKNSERKKPVTRLVLPKQSSTKSFDLENKIDKDYFASMLKTKNVESEYDDSKKYSLTSMVSRVHRNHYNTKAPRSKKTNVNALKKTLENLLVQLNETNEAKLKKKSEISVLKYIRNFFHRIFSKKRTASHKVYGLGTKEDHTLQILCENIGPCKIKRNNRMILKQKLRKLNKETKAVLKSIRTVKGLLHLLELPNSDKTLYKAKNSSFQNDIQKLGIILKNHKEGEVNSILTFTQKMQIEYIKKNTQSFIESVKKFAEVLTDILAIIKSNQQNESPLKKQKNNTASLTKIKKILYQYNIMQNTFMKKMYELINGEEKKTTTTERMVTNINYMNTKSIDQVIDKYSTNIIDNLRKLKNIAQVLSSKRRKRDLSSRDDALEYLLMLMEILLSQKLPLDTAPAQDGIDLLIDAIKNSPDMKPIRRKNLLYDPRIPTHELINTVTSDYEASNSNSNSKRISNEDKTPNSEDNVIDLNNIYSPDNTFNQDVLASASNKSESLAIQTTSADAPDKIYYRIFNKGSNNEYTTTSDYNTITKKRSFEEYEITGFDKLESYINDSKKIETETNYVEDDDVDTTTTNAPETKKVTKGNVNKEHETKVKGPKRTTALFSLAKESSSESQDVNESRPKIEWVDETFGREIRTINTTASPVKPTHTSPRPTLRPTKKKPLNISDISDEKENNNTSRESTNASDFHDVLNKKQIKFLNSLDYGTEKGADFEDSKDDDNRSDDIFPAYFA